MYEAILIVIGLVIGGSAGYSFFRYVLKKKYLRMIETANKEADVIKEKKLLEVKEKFLNKKAELEKEVQQRNQRILQVENKLKQREIGLNQRQEELGRRKQELDNTHNRLNTQQQALNRKEEELEKLQLKEREKLEELSGLSQTRPRNDWLTRSRTKHEATHKATSTISWTMPNSPPTRKQSAS